MKYVAFLRGINVGGRNMIKMSDLKLTFEKLGFENVSTHIQSGNVLFETARSSSKGLVEKIEAILPGNTKAMVRTASEIESLVSKAPFTKKHAEPKRRFVMFLREPSSGVLQFPAGSELVMRTKQDVVYYVAPGPGPFKYPNIEAQLKVPGTTRNWGVVCKIAELLSS